ncbi:methyl-accepting chemotaxis protein [Rhodocyclaceae bacterium]
MKTNLPVTQQEIPFPSGAYLVSKTDLKGAITYANEAFVEISGFTRDELVGKNHNLVRHPDMPPQAFEDLWRTVQAGLPWRGIVKNRAKNGDHYWVDAFVVPVRENDATVGYMSVRSAPSRQAVTAAEAAYRSLRESKAKLDSRPPWWKRISIRARLAAIMLFMGAMLTGGAAIGILGIMQSNTALNDTYHQQLEPIDMIGRITTLMADNRAQVMLAIQHDAVSPFAKMHDHPITTHTDAIVKNRDAIGELVKQLQARSFPSEIATHLETYRQARESFVGEGLAPARQALIDGKFEEANRILLTRTNPTYTKAAATAKDVQEAMKAHARASYTAAEERYALFRNVAIGGTLLGLLLVALAAWNLSRAIVGPLNRIIVHFDRMAQGNLTDEVDITGRDEAGRVLTQLAAMQVHLKVMLDEIQVAARTIEQQAQRVDWQTANVVDQSEQQRDRSATIAAATEEFSQSVREVADSANQAAEAAVNAQTQVTEAQGSMEESTAATGRVVDAVQASSHTIADLNLSIGKIGDISQTIREIADQTNLLALNAAIEAARAGEAGRGFAVVADEVRKLAERTSGSTADITATIAEIRHVTDAAVGSMNHAVVEVEQGIGKIHESTAGLSRITQTSQEVTGMARHIADAANEQAVASEQVASNMERIAGLIDGNLEAAKEAKEAADSLRGAAIELRRVVGRFKVMA